MPSLAGPSTLRFAEFARTVLAERIEADGWAVVEGVPCADDNAPLLQLANSLGTAKPGEARDPTHEGSAVYAVASYRQPVADVTGKPMLSTTATTFHLHTDEAYRESPARYVLLHCWRNDPGGGGISLLADSAVAAARLAPSARALCFRLRFRWRSCVSPILSECPGRAWPFVRFNAREIAGDEIGDDEADLRARQVPDMFAAAASETAFGLVLERGDCLVFDNHRFLHGRTAFDPTSPRMLKRVWVDAA